MLLTFKKPYNSNFDLLSAKKAGVGKSEDFIKVIKKSDEIGSTFEGEDWENITVAFDGLSDVETNWITVDTDQGIMDDLGNVYFQITATS